MRKHAEGSENEAMAAHLIAAHGVGPWALEPTIWKGSASPNPCPGSREVERGLLA